MADKKEISEKLNELLKKSEQFQKDLKDLNDIILYSGILEEKPAVMETPLTELPKVMLMEDIKTEDLSKQEITTEEVKPAPQEPLPVEKILEPLPPVEQVKPVEPVKKSFDFIGEKQKPREQEKPVVPAPKAKKKSFFEKNPDLEKFIGERLITFIGIAVLFTGIAFFVKYAIDKDWINETGRAFIGILSGGILIGIAHRLHKTFRTFSSVLIGGGIAVEYFTITYAHHVYHLFPGQLATLAILVGVTLFTVVLSVLYDRQELAVIAIAGGFLTPLMVAESNGKLMPLGAYILTLDIGMLVLSYYKRWRSIHFISYFFTIALFGGAIAREFSTKESPDYTVALAYCTAFYFVFFSMNVINQLKLGLKFNGGEILVLISNTMIYYVAGYYILNHIGDKSYHGIFTIGVAVFNFIFAYVLYKRQNIDRNLIYLLIGIVITFISLAGPVQLDGNNITLFWAAESVLLLWLFQRSGIVLLGYASVVLNVLLLGSLVIANWANSALSTFVFAETEAIDQPFMSNRFFVTSLFALGSLMASHFLLTRQKTADLVKGFKMEPYKRFIGITILVIAYLSFFMEFYAQTVIHAFSFAERVVCLATYSALFTAVFITVMRYRNFDHLKAIALIMGIGIMLVHIFYFNMAVIEVRNDTLAGTGIYRVYLLHYLLTALVAGIAVLLFLEIRRSKQYESLFQGYLLIVSVLTVFIMSTETDHLMISQGYTGAESIARLRSLSGNIAYPVVWGICSFVMMIIGMRKQVRQLRILSLCLLAITIVKLIWLGINGDSEAGKIIAFISSGIVLMVVAFMYQKLKKLITERDQPK